MFCIEQHCQVGLGVCCGIASSETKTLTWMNTCAWLDCTATHRFTTPVFIFIWRILGSCGAMISTCLTANTSWYGLQKRRLLLSLCKLLRSRIQYQARPSTAAAASKSAFQHGADTKNKNDAIDAKAYGIGLRTAVSVWQLHQQRRAFSL